MDPCLSIAAAAPTKDRPMGPSHFISSARVAREVSSRSLARCRIAAASLPFGRSLDGDVPMSALAVSLPQQRTHYTTRTGAPRRRGS